jgi:hypothetical protein
MLKYFQMNHAEIDVSFSEIKNTIKKGKISEAIDKLELFISKIDDTELENQILSYSARYNRLESDKKLGVNTDKSGQDFNEIVNNLTHLLREAKQIAIEKASMLVGSQLSELAKEGSNAIEELKKLNIIIAESRLLELQVMRMSFGSFFSPQQNEKFDKNIDDLKEVLNKKDEDLGEIKDGSTNFLTQMHHKFEEIIPIQPPSIDDVMGLIGQIQNKLMNDSSNLKE